MTELNNKVEGINQMSYVNITDIFIVKSFEEEKIALILSSVNIIRI